MNFHVIRNKPSWGQKELCWNELAWISWNTGEASLIIRQAGLGHLTLRFKPMNRAIELKIWRYYGL